MTFSLLYDCIMFLSLYSSMLHKLYIRIMHWKLMPSLCYERLREERLFKGIRQKQLYCALINVGFIYNWSCWWLFTTFLYYYVYSETLIFFFFFCLRRVNKRREKIKFSYYTLLCEDLIDPSNGIFELEIKRTADI